MHGDTAGSSALLLDLAGPDKPNLGGPSDMRRAAGLQIQRHGCRADPQEAHPYEAYPGLLLRRRDR
mgnify:CR=1 FL=1